MGDRSDVPVLFVHHRDVSTPIGTTVPYYVSSELADSHDVHVVCRKRDVEGHDAAEHGGTIHAIDTGDVPVLSAVAFHLLACLAVAVLGLRYRYEVVYAFQSTLVQGWIGSRVSNGRFVVGLQSVPVRQTTDFADFAGSRDTLSKRVTFSLYSMYASVVGAILERSDAVVCLTRGIREVTEAQYDVDLSDAHVIGMGVDVDAFQAERQDRRPASSTEEVTLVYIGTVQETRGLEHVIEAVERVEGVRFEMAGQGPEEYVESLRRDARERSIADRVEWHGLLPHEEIPRLLARADVAVLPLPDIESYRISFPAKLLEYMAAGTLVAATDIPAHRQLIDDGTNGLLYDGTPGELAGILQQCVDDQESIREVSRRAIATAEAHDWSAVVDRHRAVMFDSTPKGGARSATESGDPRTV